MVSRSKIAALIISAAAAAAAAVVAAAPAQAQYYSSVQTPPPLYPYQQQPRATQSYAVEVAPGTYVIHRPGEARTHHRRAPRAALLERRHGKALHSRNDRRVIEELKQRADRSPNGAINTTKVVRLKPKVVETTRYVDDPPRVVERYTVVDDTNGEKKVVVDAPPSDRHKPGKNAEGKNAEGKSEKRVIRADAEITVLGPDRMTIQLYRKGERGKPSARLN